MVRSSLLPLLLLVFASTISVGPAGAQSDRLSLSLRALGTQYEDELSLEFFTNRSTISYDGGYGVELAGSYRMLPRLSLEISLAELRLNAETQAIALVPDFTKDPVEIREELRFSESGDFLVRPLAIAALFDLVSRSQAVLYGGPQLAWVSFDTRLEGISSRDPEFAYGAKLGALLGREGSPWRLNLEVRYLHTRFDRRDQRELHRDFDLTVASIGLAYSMGA